MARNPLSKLVKTATATVTDLRKRSEDLQTQLAWCAGFDRTAAVADQGAAEKKFVNFSQYLSTVEAEISESRQLTKKLEDKASIGWDITYWFSSDRDKAKSRLNAHRSLLKELNSKKQMTSKRRDEEKEEALAQQAAIATFDAFDVEKADAELAAIAMELPVREAELDHLKVRKTELDRQLKVPQRELDKLESDLSDLERRATKLGDRVRSAERLDDRITRAPNSYERAMLHKECESEFGDSRPRNVVRAAQKELSENSRQAAAVRRDMQKLEARIDQLCERAARVVLAVVIDGNNLCYEGREFIGLPALKAVAHRLAESYAVTVVFDASIRRLLASDGSALEREFEPVKVHVVATRVKADETILDAASDDSTYVLSNDRFAEFRDKAAVRKQRVLRHEIINGRVLAHDLDVNESFASGRSRVAR